MGGRHSHVDRKDNGDAVAALHAEIGQNIRERVGALVQLAVGHPFDPVVVLDEQRLLIRPLPGVPVADVLRDVVKFRNVPAMRRPDRLVGLCSIARHQLSPVAVV